MLKQREDGPFEKLLKPEEAWTTLRISRPTFYRCVQDGSLRVVRMRSAILVPESSVRDALRNGLPREKQAV
jgi:excisionase family DNA binding protein